MGLLLIAWIFVCGFCEGKFVVEKNNLKVTSPKSLKGVYECAIGNFGVPKYGGAMVGSVVYPKTNHKGCNSFNDDSLFKSKPGSFPAILLVDRGGEVTNLFHSYPAAILILHVTCVFICPCFWAVMDFSTEILCLKLHSVFCL